MSDYFSKQKYPVDLTGVSPNNLIADERHALTQDYRVIVPHHGAFYQDGFVVVYRGNRLTANVDFKFKDLFKEGTERSGKSCYHAIVFINDTIVGDVTLRYQAFGDNDFTSAIARYISNISFDDRNVQWENVFNKPLKYPSTYHGHHVDDLRGIGPIITCLQAIETAIENLRARNNLKFQTLLMEHYTKLNTRFDSLRAIANRQLEIEGMLATHREEMESMLETTRRNIEIIGTSWDARLDAIDTKLADHDDKFNTKYVKKTENSWANLLSKPRIPTYSVTSATNEVFYKVNFGNSGVAGLAGTTTADNSFEFMASQARLKISTTLNNTTYSGITALMSDLNWGSISNKPNIPTFQYVSTASRNGSRITLLANPSPNSAWRSVSDFNIDIDEKAQTMRVSNTLNGKTWNEEFLFRRHLTALNEGIPYLKTSTPYSRDGALETTPARVSALNELTEVKKTYGLTSISKNVGTGIDVGSSLDSSMSVDYLNRSVKFRLGLSHESNSTEREVAFKDWVEDAVIQPIGCIVLWSNSGDLPDTKWLRCDGQKHYINDYPELYQVLGEKYLTDTTMDRTQWFQTPYLSLGAITRDSDICFIIRARP